MTGSLVTELLPVLSQSREPEFNVFDVMHHGMHEKQLSNVFRWLLDADNTHGLDGAFAKAFIEELNSARPTHHPLPLDGYWVSQEVNTSAKGEARDIADLVLESTSAVVVIENYFTSDGHGHSFEGYLRHATQQGKDGAVVLLCQDHDLSRQVDGWQDAVVLTYAQLTDRLIELVGADQAYQREHPEAFTFIEQLHRKFTKGKGRMMDADVLNFVTRMCVTGDARRYQDQNQTAAAEQFAIDLAEQGRHQFKEGRELLQRLKGRLKNYASGPLLRQLNETLGDGFVTDVSARYAGLYQWTINFETSEGELTGDEARLQIKFGPSAWHANERDNHWKVTVAPDAVDYSRLFLTRRKNKEIRQSAVTLQDVINGLDPTDMRLHDELVTMVRGS